MKNRKGISLIVLVITIIIITILAVVVIINITKNDPIKNAEQALFKSDMKNYDYQIRTSILDSYQENPEIMEKVITSKEEIQKYSKELVDSQYADIAYISDGVLTLRGKYITEEQRKWAIEANIKIDSSVEVSDKIDIELSSLNWTNQDIIATLKYANIPEGYVIQYKTGDNEWKDGSSCTITENTVITARLYNKQLEDEIAGCSEQVDNIDKLNPKVVSIESSEIGTNSFILTVTANDETATLQNGCSDIKEYEYYINSELYESSFSNVCNVNVDLAGTNYSYYVIVRDNAGNEITSEKSDVQTIATYEVEYDLRGGTGNVESQLKIHDVDLILEGTAPTKNGYTFLGWSSNASSTTKEYSFGDTYTINKEITLYAVWQQNNIAPVISSRSVKERNTNYITITAKATDADADKLTYKLYVRTSSGSYSTTPNATSTATASGTSVELKANGLSKYTIYKYKVEVTDGKTVVSSAELTTSTGCDGTGYTCSKGVLTQEECGRFKMYKDIVVTSCGPCDCVALSTGTYRCNSCGTTKYLSFCGCGHTVSANYNPEAHSSTTLIHTIDKYVCSTHSYESTSSTHSYCSHNKTSLHFPN